MTGPKNPSAERITLRTNLRKVAGLAGAVAALAAVAATVPLAATTAGAVQLPPAAPSSGPVTLAPATGNSGTTFQMTPPTGAACNNSGANGWRFHTFIAPLTSDPSQLDYNTFGTPGPLPIANLRNGSSQIRNVSPAIGNNFVSAQSLNYTSPAFGAASLPPGEYWVGFACTSPDGFITPTDLSGPKDTFLDVEQYWATAITIEAAAGAGPNNFVWGVPAVPAAPAISVQAAGDGQLDLGLTQPLSVPSVTAYTATAVGGGTTVGPVPITGPDYILSGLQNGVTYDVTVSATNSLGSTSSNTVSGTPVLPVLNPPTGLTATAGDPGEATLSWTAPVNANGVGATSYNVTLTPADDGPFTGLTTTSQLVTGLDSSTDYTFTVQAVYPAPFASQSATSAPFKVNPDALVYQKITVVRPEGFLVLTQRCGVFGDLPGELGDYTVAGGGYPRDLLDYTGNDTFPLGGTAPFLSDTLTGAQDNDAGQFAPAGGLGGYPNPLDPQYPTYCGIRLGNAALVTDGEFAGHYIADGNLNQVTVLDARSSTSDSGWTLSGQMSPFSDGAGETFEGDYLGWTPWVTDVSGVDSPANGSDATVTGTSPSYVQKVTAGAKVQPGTAGGLGDAAGEVLASASAGEGLGVARIDARIKLVIPPDVPAGTYTGLLKLSVA